MLSLASSQIVQNLYVRPLSITVYRSFATNTPEGGKSNQDSKKTNNNSLDDLRNVFKNAFKAGANGEEGQLEKAFSMNSKHPNEGKPYWSNQKYSNEPQKQSDNRGFKEKQTINSSIGKKKQFDPQMYKQQGKSKNSNEDRLTENSTSKTFGNYKENKQGSSLNTNMNIDTNLTENQPKPGQMDKEPDQSLEEIGVLDSLDKKSMDEYIAKIIRHLKMNEDKILARTEEIMDNINSKTQEGQNGQQNEQVDIHLNFPEFFSPNHESGSTKNSNISDNCLISSSDDEIPINKTKTIYDLKEIIPYFHFPIRSSLLNPIILEIQKYSASAKEMRKGNKFLVGNPFILNEFLKMGYIPEKVAYCDKILIAPKIQKLFENFNKIRAESLLYTTGQNIRLAGDITCNQGLVALFNRPENGEIESKSSRFLIYDKLSHPRDIGLLLQSAVSFGADTVVVIKGCTDIWSSKVVSVAQGAHLHIKIVEYESWEVALEKLKQNKVRLIAAVENGVSNYNKVRVKKSEKLGLIIGNKFDQLSPIIQKLITENNIEGVHVPVKNPFSFELNLCTKGSIIMSKLFPIQTTSTKINQSKI